MTALRVYGGLAGGTVAISGHKHSSVAIIAAAALADSAVAIANVPDIEDVRVMAAILGQAGARVTRSGDVLEMDASGLEDPVIPTVDGRLVHGSIYLVPVLLGRLGTVSYAGSGGCRIGSSALGGERPVRHVVDVLRRFGAEFEIVGERLEGRAKRLRATEVDVMDFSERDDVLTGPLVSGATKTALLAAAAAEGTTVIRNPYPKPDTLELARFLRVCGHEVSFAPGELRVGPARDRPPAVRHELVADLGEIVTFLVAGLLLGVRIRVTGIGLERAREGLGPELELFKRMGIDVVWGPDGVEARAPGRWSAVDVEVTSVGIYSDHQPLFALLLLQGERASSIVEHVWADRFAYAAELAKLGARVNVQGNVLSVEPSRLRKSERELIATDVRAAASLLLAALSVPGETVVEGVEHLPRGYVDLPGALRSLGARIEPVPSPVGGSM